MSAEVTRDDLCLKVDQHSEPFTFPEFVGCAKFIVEWSSRSKMFCELKLQIYCYDERARFIEKLNDHKTQTDDGACHLVSQVNPSTGSQDKYVATAKIEFDKVSEKTAAIAIFLNGEPRIFQFVDHISFLCTHVPANGDEVSFMLTTLGTNTDLFRAVMRPHKEYQGICLAVLYKEKWVEHKSDEGKVSMTSIWASKVVLEPCFMQTNREKDEKVQQATVFAVPAMERYRPRIFENIRDMCAALSSKSLPKLKKSFLRSATGGLNLEQFTSVLFNQLYETHPKVADPTERGYVVALIHEMFSQMDYNNDNCNDWDEFTTFCVQIGVGAAGNKEDESSTDARNLDQYVIEYGEDVLLRDHFLSQQRGVATLREIPNSSRIVLIQEEGESVIIIDEDFRPRTSFEPSKLISYGPADRSHGKKPAESITAGAYRRIFVYDCIFLTGKDLYATCSSDHAITLIKESTTLATGKAKSSFVLTNRIYHNMLHTRLCWIQATEVLCSVGSDHLIYGWNIESKHPIFQVNRHEDVITDFIAVEHMEVFVTCSMDKRIVMWSAKSRRVRGILLGHERGVRCLSNHDNILLSAGFETDAFTWDLNSKEQIGVLRGHRATITAAKLMCAMAPTDKEHRAVTVDETGEFRLWDIHIAERSSEPTPAITLQIFEMHGGEPPLNRFKFIIIPNNKKRSTTYYSDIVACSTKLFHFLPEKNTKEFVAPTCCVFNEAAASIATAVGKSVSKYDVTNGKFTNIYADITTTDISAMCLDADKQRYLFIGCHGGDVLLVNYMTGQTLDRVEAHSKEVTCLTAFKRTQNKCCAGFADGKLKMLEEIGGKIRVHNTLDDPFGPAVAVNHLKISSHLRAIVASSVNNAWGIWNDTSFRRIMLIREKSTVNSIEIIRASVIKGSDDLRKEGVQTTENKPREHLLTVAIAISLCIRIYTVDMLSMRGIISHELLTLDQVYVTHMCLLRSPKFSGVNYSISSAQDIVIGNQLVVTTDGGQILTWDMNVMSTDSEKKFHMKYAQLQKMEHSLHHSNSHDSKDGKHMTIASVADVVVKMKSWCHQTQQVVHSHESEAEFRKHAAGIDSSYFLTDSSVMHENHGGHGVLSKSNSYRESEAYRKFHEEHSLESRMELQHHQIVHEQPQHIELRDLRDSVHINNKAGHSHAPVHGHVPGHGAHPNHALDHTHNFAPPQYSHNIFINRRPSVEGRRPSIEHHPAPHGTGVQDQNHTNNGHQQQRVRRFSTDRTPDGTTTSNGSSPHKKSTGDVFSLTNPGDVGSGRKKDSPKKQRPQTAPKDVFNGTTMASRPNLGLLRKCIADRCWGAHLDSIVSLQPLHEHGCILTVSLDGYHRIWNMHEQCLGEMPLPNITDKMKNPVIKLNACDHWMFILEKLRVSDAHLQIANDLVDQIAIKQSQYRIPARMTTVSPQQLVGNQSGLLSINTANISRKQSSKSATESASSSKKQLDGRQSRLQFYDSFAEDSEYEHPITAREVQAAQLRSQVLTDLVSPPQLTEDAPPLRALTREEKRLEEKNLRMLSSLGLLPDINESSVQPPSTGSKKILGINHNNNSTATSAKGKNNLLTKSISFEKSITDPSASPTGGSQLGLVPGTMLNSMSTLDLANHNMPRPSTTGSIMLVPKGELPMWSTSEDFCAHVQGNLNASPGCFSEASLTYSRHDGYINGEEYSLLRRVSDQPEKVSVYDRTEPTLFLRNPKLATSFEIPNVELADKSEISFGSQKSLYRNASKYIDDKDRQNKQSLLHSLSMARINRDVSKVKSMIHVLPGRVHDDVVIPKDNDDESENDKLRSEEQKMRLRLIQSAALVPREATVRPLDKDNIDRLIDKYKTITESSDKQKAKSYFKKKFMTHTMKMKLTAKLELAIKDAYKYRRQMQLPSSLRDNSVPATGDKAKSSSKPVPNATSKGTGTPAATATGGGDEQHKSDQHHPNEQHEHHHHHHDAAEHDHDSSGHHQHEHHGPGAGTAAASHNSPRRPSITGTSTSAAKAEDKSPQRIKLTTRQLLPYYSLDDVTNFMDTFAKVDEDFSGDLDIVEWVRLFNSMNHHMSEHDARMIFMKLDKNGDGYLTMRELIPVIFSRASRAQLKLITEYASFELIKKQDGITTLSLVEMEQLFEMYDVNHIGYVAVKSIRDHVNKMNLPEAPLYMFLDTLSHAGEDEMVNLAEFIRLLKLYVEKSV